MQYRGLKKRTGFWAGYSMIILINTTPQKIIEVIIKAPTVASSTFQRSKDSETEEFKNLKKLSLRRHAASIRGPLHVVLLGH